MLKRTQGLAMLYALLLMVVVVGISALMFARTVAEIQHSGDDAAIVQTLLLARGSANMGGQLLQGVVRTELHSIVEATSNMSGRWSFGTGATGSTPEVPSVTTALNAVANSLQTRIDAVLCGNSQFAPSTGGLGQFRVHFTANACGEPLPDGVRLPTGRFVGGQPRQGTAAQGEQTYAIPFVMVAEGSLGQYRRNVVLQGEYRFLVGRGSFAKYALFTNVHRTSAADTSSTRVWFTGDTLFDGPVHTNNHFRFYRDAWFGGSVTTAGCANPGATSCTGNDFGRRGAEFYDQGFVTHTNMNPNSNRPSYTNSYGTHAPSFGTVDWQAGFVPLPGNNQNQRDAASTGGLHFGNGVSLHSLTLSARDGAGNLLTPLGNGTYAPAASWQYIESCTSSSASSCTVRRYDAAGNLYRRTGSAPLYTWVLDRTNFNGVLYVDGAVDRFRGPGRVDENNDSTGRAAVAAFAQITVAAEGRVRITGDLRYEREPCVGVPTRNGDRSVTPANCNDLGANNVLGVYTQSGDVLVGNNNGDSTLNAPRNVHIHGILMTSTGRVQVEAFDSGSARGDVHLLGGIIEYYYGAFGTFNASTNTQTSGFGR
ncbi:MAG: DUF4900 domain-containing protein, partial [Trueperaceae bacterium]|nr:DUF4900 domain-containing protein [Trueperaceae bacterium]